VVALIHRTGILTLAVAGWQVLCHPAHDDDGDHLRVLLTENGWDV
jgi:hypothetical protein